MQVHQRLIVDRFRSLVNPKKWLRIFVGVILLLMWALIAFEIVEEREDAQHEWIENLGNITRATGEHTIRTIASIDQDLKFVRNLYLRDGHDLDLNTLSKIGGVDQLYIRLGIIDSTGVYAISDHALRPTYNRDIEDFDAQLSNPVDSLLISKPALSNVSAKHSIHFSRRIVDAGGRFVGVAVASIDPRFFGNLYSDVHLGQNGIVALAGEDGILRARWENGNFTVGSTISAAPIFSTLKNVASGTFYNTGVNDKIKRLFTFHRLPGLDLIVITGVTEKQVFERSNSALEAYMALGISATLILLLFSWAFDRLLIKQDLTLRALRDSQRAAETANLAKTEFLASMSHELRTPLNGVLGFADILRRKAAVPGDRRKAEIIHTSGSHLLDLLNSILDLAKIEAGKMDVYRRAEELAPLIRSTVAVHEMSAQSKNLQLQLELDSALPELLVCDKTLLRQVLNNLISNAIKFTEQGSVTIRVDCGDRPGFLHFEVQDSGMGIPPECLQAVFEKFRQVDQSLTRSHQGTGLGLSLAKQLVELMGGEIGLVSQPGEGTTIHFTLPTCEDLRLVMEEAEPARQD